MNLQTLIAQLDADGALVTIEKEVDPNLEMARVIQALGDRAVLFKNVHGSPVAVVANLCARREYLARAIDAPVERLLFVLAEALARPASR
jgi:UbiD family decarboxylase